MFTFGVSLVSKPDMSPGIIPREGAGAAREEGTGGMESPGEGALGAGPEGAEPCPDSWACAAASCCWSCFNSRNWRWNSADLSAICDLKKIIRVLL